MRTRRYWIKQERLSVPTYRKRSPLEPLHLPVFAAPAKQTRCKYVLQRPRSARQVSAPLVRASTFDYLNHRRFFFTEGAGGTRTTFRGKRFPTLSDVEHRPEVRFRPEHSSQLHYWKYRVSRFRIRVSLLDRVLESPETREVRFPGLRELRLDPALGLSSRSSKSSDKNVVDFSVQLGTTESPMLL